MSDAFAAANMISGQLSYYRMMDGLRAARARRDYENEIAYVQACNDWLTRNLKRVCDEYGRLVDTANAREADYRRRIADLEQENANLEAKYKERDALAVQDAARSREDYNRLVEKHKSILGCYKTLLMRAPPSAFSGNSRLLTDYETVRDSGYKPEGG